MPAEGRPVRRWGYVVVFVCVAGGYFGLSVLTGDRHSLRNTVVWVLIIGVALGVLWLWKRLPARVRTEPPRFSRDELIRATFEAIWLFGVVVLPDLIRHGLSMRTWVLGPIFLLGLIAAWLLWVLPSERADADLVESGWRRLRPHPRPKVR
jgi:hypothetical protein